jgi:hypothetical protein
MGHDAGHLVFWKPKVAKVSDPAGVLKALEAGELPAALTEIDVPRVLTELRRIYRTFKARSPAEIDLPKPETAITISWSARHFSFFFEGDAFKQMDKVSLVMSRLGLSTYDVLAAKIYATDAPPRFVGTAEEEARFKIYWRIMFAHQMRSC